MKRLSLCAVLFLSFFLFARSASAQSIDGPFFGKQALVNYWAANQGSQATEIYLNGYLLHWSIGFGPAFFKSYYQCSDGLIRSNCNALNGPFRNGSDAKAYVNNVVGNSTSFIRLDVTILQNGSGSWFFQFKTCYGDPSPFSGNTVNYVLLDYYSSTSSGSIPGLACLPRL
ncbi:hypothetical protein [Hyalangium versicolor]|uniref:hypothetical protein n=1 Tax=Hyalangium versicolor TaxID=2861190 RepID=UPI001CCCF2F1|nr:hypothetical protein [Hyalangium versicolor]